MKQMNLSNKTKGRCPGGSSGWRFWCMILLAVLVGTASSWGQITWSTVTLTPNVLPVAGKPAQLSFKALTSAAITLPTIEISLPDHITYTSGSGQLYLGSVQQSGVTFDTSTANKIIITGLSSIASGVEVEALLFLNAESGAELNPDDVTVNLQFYDADQAFGVVKETAPVVAKVPGITITPKELSIPYLDKTKKHTYTLTIGATDVEINNFELRLTVDDKTTLEDIQINDGTALTEGTGAGQYTKTGTVYTIPVSETQLGGVIAAGTNNNKITFKASSTLEALRTIKVEAAYPDFTSSYATAVEVELLMAYDLPGGKPVLNHYDLANESYYTATPTIGAAKIATDDIPMNLTTTSYARTLFKNTGDAAASIVEFDVYPYGAFSIVDIADVWYSINNGAPVKIEGITGKKSGGRPAYQGPLKNDYKDSPNVFKVRIDTIIPVQGLLELWVATKNGQIYDVSNDLNVYTTDPTTISGYRINISYCESPAQIQGTSLSPSYVIAYQGYPHFKEVPNRKVYQPNDTYTQTILFGTNAGGKTKGKFEVELDIPAWLTLQTDGVKWLSTNGNSLGTATKVSETKYVFDYVYLNESFLSFDFKAGTSLTDEQGVVRYKINHLPSGETTNRIDKISQVIQSVSLWVENNGVTLVSPASGIDPFRLIRKTTGFLDDNNNGIPNNPQKRAKETDNILHTSYINGDKGKMVWDGQILGDYAAGGTLYLVGELKELDKSKFTWEALSATVGGATVTPTITWDNDATGTKFVIKYTGSLPQNALFHVELPFELSEKNIEDKMASVETRCYIHTASDKNPNMETADGCLGNAIASSPFGVYSLDMRIGGIGGDSASEEFADNGNKAFSAEIHILRFAKLRTPFFSKEARILALPGVFQMTLPEGYEMVGNTVTLKFIPSNTGRSTETINSYPLSNPSPGIYTVDLTNIFDIAQDENSGGPESGKFSFPDDKWQIQVNGYYKALNNAASVSTMNFSVEMRKEDGTSLEPLANKSVTFNYSGASIDVTTADANTTKPIPGKVGTSLISLSNTATSALTDVWLYIDGDVKNVKLLDSATGADVPGGGGISGSNWIKLPSGLPASPTSLSYVLSVEHKGSTPSPFPVRIQTVSDYNKGGYTPVVATDVLADIPEANKGRAQTITFSPQQATVSGELTSSTQTLTFNTPFMLTASINSERSSGHLYDGSMTLHIPAGYEFVGGVANTAAYNGGTPVALPIAIQTALSAMADAGGDITLKVSDVLTSNDVLVGLTGREGADNKVEVKFNIQLKPVCNITLTDRITANIFGKDAYGAAAVRNNDEIKLPRMSATGVDFNFNVSVTPSQKAFGYADTDRKTIDVTIEKLLNNPVAAVTYLEVTLPSVLNLDGNKVAVSSTDVTLTDTELTIGTTDNVVSGNTRTLKIAIPAADYNATGADNGAHKKISYTIPVKYTYPTAGSPIHTNLVGFPEQNIEATVITDVSFGDASCGTITPQPNPLVSKAEKIAFLMTDMDDSFKVFVGGTADWTIQSAGFDGTTTATDGTLSVNVLTIAPTAASYPDATAFTAESGKKTEKAIVTVSFGGNTYGTVELPYVVYPSLIYTLSSNEVTAGCGSTTFTLDDLVTKESQYTNVFFYSDAACTAQVTGTDQSKSVSSETTYYVRSENLGGKETINPANKVTVKVNTDLGGVTLTAVDADLIVGETLTINATVATPANIPSDAVYTWYKDGTSLGTTTGLTYTKTVSATTESGSYTLEITSPSKGLCGNISAAVAITVTDRPEQVTLTVADPTNLKTCALTDAVPVTITWSNNFTKGETVWFSKTSDENDAVEYTSGSSTIVLNGWGNNTIYVWAKNPGVSGNFSAQASTFVINLTQYTAVTLANIADIELEAAAGTNATATITAVASGDKDPGTGMYTYNLYEGTNPTAVDGPTTTAGANTFAGQSVAAPALTYTTESHLAYTFKAVASGACSPAAEKTVSVKVYPTPVVSLKAANVEPRTFCNATAMTINLWDYLDIPNTTLFSYEYSVDGTTYNSLASGTTVSVPANGTAKTINIRAKNKKTTPTTSTAVDLVLTVNVPVEAVAFNPATINLEGLATTTITVPVPTVGTPDANGDFTYNLYNVSGDALVGGPLTTNAFTSVSLPSVPNNQSHSTISFYATIQGAATCASATRSSNNVTVNVYPDPVIALKSATTKAFCTTDLTSSPVKLDSYIDALNRDMYDYFYIVDGGNETALDASVELLTGAGTHTYSLIAKNKYSASVKSANVPLVINVYTPITLTAAANPVNVEEATVKTTITATVTNTGVVTGGYELWRPGETTADDAATGNTFDVPYSAPTDANAEKKTITYYVKALGAITCADGTSGNVTVNMYPTPVLTLTPLALVTAYCEDDATLLGGIDLWDYIDNPNTTWFTYTYTGGTVTDGALGAGTVSIPTAPGIYSYTIKAVNKLGAASAHQNITQTVTITVHEKTAISGVSGIDVTEGEAVTFVAAATGDASATLQYEWFEDVNGSWNSLGAATPLNTFTAIQSANLNDNGKKYRLEVTGASSCSSALYDFTLKVKSRTNPPLGNNKVTWTVIGYGNVTVTADGYAISNGSHVNDGANLVITATTWKSNVLESITINGSNYSGPQVSYIAANRSNVNIIVTFSGSDPNPDPDSNATIEDGSRIWSEGGYAYIYSETATRARIVTFNGRLVTDQKLSAGENRIQLPDGYYIVTLSDGTTKKIAVRNF